MKTDKQWKRVPFDIELAKKIQSGEVEGRIITSLDNVEMEILTFNSFDKEYPIIARYKDIENMGVELYEYHMDGRTNPDGISFWFDLIIELPEEEPKQKGELTLGKCKEGDEVWIFSNYDYGPEYVKVKVGKFSIDRSSGRRRNIIFENGFTCQELTSQICWYENPNEQKAKTKEFKPFDKVLVRYPDKAELCVSRDIWLPGIFQYKSVNSSLYFVSGKSYKDCIPYEGNEYLAGTTDKPKKE